MYINKNNLENEKLPDKKYVYNMLKLKDINDNEYKEVKNFIKIWYLKILKNI